MTPLVLAAMLTCGELTSPALETLSGGQARITLGLEKTSLDRVFRALGEQAGFRVSFRGFTPVVTARYEDVPVQQVVRELADRHALLVRASAPDRLEVRGPAAAEVGGATAPRFKEGENPGPVPGLHGKVRLHVVVCEDGTVGAVAEAPGTEEPRLVASAMEAVRGWIYEPAVKDGKPVAAAFVVVVDFRAN